MGAAATAVAVAVVAIGLAHMKLVCCYMGFQPNVGGVFDNSLVGDGMFFVMLPMQTMAKKLLTGKQEA